MLWFIFSSQNLIVLKPVRNNKQKFSEWRLPLWLQSSYTRTTDLRQVFRILLRVKFVFTFNTHSNFQHYMSEKQIEIHRSCSDINPDFSSYFIYMSLNIAWYCSFTILNLTFSPGFVPIIIPRIFTNLAKRFRSQI